MRKTNFLKGLGAKLALAVVAFGAVLTSCTKEEFNVDFKPSNAQIYFAPTVIDAATNSVVTDATVTGADAITGTPAIAAGSVTITAEKNGVKGSATIQYGAVPAGSVATYSPVILLSSDFELKNVKATALETTVKYGKGEEGHSHDGKSFNSNASDYYMPFSTSFTFTGKLSDVELNASVTSVELNAYAASLEGKESSFEAKLEGKASAWSYYTAKAEITSAKIDAAVVSKATGATVGTISFVNPVYNVVLTKYEIAHPSHAHNYEHGHGHGDSANAGGGITWAE